MIIYNIIHILYINILYIYYNTYSDSLRFHGIISYNQFNDVHVARQRRVLSY